MAKNYRRDFCPLCSRPLPVVQGTGQHLGSLFFDCFHCGKAGRLNQSSGAIEEEICDLPNFDWTKWGKK